MRVFEGASFQELLPFAVQAGSVDEGLPRWLGDLLL